MVAAAIKQKPSNLSFFVIAWLAIIGLSIGLQLLPNWFIKKLAVSTDSLTPLGKVEDESGYNRRRHATDLSWLSMNADDLVYEGDRIYTGESASMKLALSDGSTVTLRPRSFVQIRYGRNGLTIDLSEGDVKVEPKKSAITVRSVEKDRLEQPEVEKPVQPLPEEAKVAADPGPPPPAATAEPTRFATYPKDGSLVFYTKSRQLVAVAGPRCEQSCTVRALLNGHVWSTSARSANEIPNLNLDLSDAPEGEVTLQLEQDLKLSTSTFELRKYSNANMDGALSTGKPIEILE